MYRNGLLLTSEMGCNGRVHYSARLMCLLVCLFCRCPLALSAEVTPAARSQELAAQRNQVFVIVAGDSHTASTLASVLLPRLMDQSAELRFESVVRLSRSKLRVLMTEQSARFIAVLDASDAEQWHLTIFEPATNRAMARSLAGSSVDQAAVEAAISIIVSANQVLAAGEPVGDLSVEQALASQPLDDGTRTETRRPLTTATHPDTIHTPNPSTTTGTTKPEPTKLAIDFALALLSEPLAQPGGHGMDWNITATARGSRFSAYAGPGLTMGFPTTTPTALGHSEFHRFQLSVALGCALKLGSYTELGLVVEPLLERVQARHRASVTAVTPRDNPATWAFASRAGAEGRLWLLPNLGVGATTGVMLRPNAPVYVDSRGQTLLTTTRAAWFVQFGALFRFMP